MKQNICYFNEEGKVYHFIEVLFSSLKLIFFKVGIIGIDKPYGLSSIGKVLNIWLGLKTTDGKRIFKKNKNN